MPRLTVPVHVSSKFHQHAIDVHLRKEQGGPKAVSLFASRRSKARRKYWPRAVTEADKAAWERLKRAYGANTDNRDRVNDDYDVFLRASLLESNAESLGWFLGQMSRDLAASSCASYLKHVLAKNRVNGSKLVRNVAEAYNADTIGGHAPDIELNVLLKYIELAPPEIQPVLWLLLVTGLRVKDLSRLRRRQIARKKTGLSFLLCLTKGRRRRCLRCKLDIPAEWHGKIPDSLIEILVQSRQSKKKRIFKNHTANKLNAQLRKMSKSHNLPRPTTYSFRRHYMNFIVEKCGGDVARQATFTKHISASITEAHYVRFEEDPDLESGSSDDDEQEASEDEA